MQTATFLTQQFQTDDPLTEDMLMTFQVALIATDGIIVGSDRRIAVKSGQSGPHGDWQFMAGSKFVTTQDESVICAGAGGPQAQTIAQAIVNRGNPGQTYAAWCESLRQIAESVSGNSVGDEVIVVRKNALDAVLVNRNTKLASTSQIADRICTGVTATGRFLTQHFWESTHVDQLKKLALVVLDYAAKERPTEVGEGFDLMLLRAGTVTWERYGPDDERIRAIREGFQTSVRSWLFPGAC
jgi:hypothetical protein